MIRGQCLSTNVTNYLQCYIIKFPSLLMRSFAFLLGPNSNFFFFLISYLLSLMLFINYYKNMCVTSSLTVKSSVFLDIDVISSVSCKASSVHSHVKVWSNSPKPLELLSKFQIYFADKYFLTGNLNNPHAWNIFECLSPFLSIEDK